MKLRTVDHYRMLLDKHLLPTFATVRLPSLTAPLVVRWHTAMGTGTPTLRAHCYGLLRSILGTAVEDGLLMVNPAHIRGGASSVRVHRVRTRKGRFKF